VVQVLFSFDSGSSVVFFGSIFQLSDACIDVFFLENAKEFAFLFIAKKGFLLQASEEVITA
jgi:hypothetical protein